MHQQAVFFLDVDVDVTVMGARYRFRPSLILTLAALAAVGVATALGLWQLDRAQQKRALNARVEQAAAGPRLELSAVLVKAEDVSFHSVLARGEFQPQFTVYLDNRTRKGKAGYEIFTPLRLRDSSMHVLVNRGWISAGRLRSELPAVRTPSAEVVVQGIAMAQGGRYLKLGAESEAGKVWQNLNLERYRARFRLDLQPVYIRQSNDTADGLMREWPQPAMGVDRHRAYAWQWFSLALLVLILYGVLNVKRDSAA